MFVVVANYLVPKGYLAVTIFPFILLADKKGASNQILLQHEKIHIRQQMELLVLPFFIWYLIEYAFQFARFRNHSQAYRSISFEREAYDQESNPDYLKSRGFFQFLSYIR